MARFLHTKSKRAQQSFISVNWAAIPGSLLESELFGHEKGAFTGAVTRRIGKFEEANGGTLLLDEISEMHPRLQAKLLRAIQEREIDRVGGGIPARSEEHTSELQSLMRISYAVFCLKKKKNKHNNNQNTQQQTKDRLTNGHSDIKIDKHY